MPKVLDWLLEPSQPAVRYLTMRDLVGGASRADLEKAKRAIASRGWVADIFAEQKPGGYWVSGEKLYRPKYISTNWMLLTLSDLGVTRKDPRIAKACSLWMDRFFKADGGFNADGATKKSEHCLTGNTARALTVLKRLGEFDAWPTDGWSSRAPLQPNGASRPRFNGPAKGSARRVVQPD